MQKTYLETDLAVGSMQSCGVHYAANATTSSPFVGRNALEQGDGGSTERSATSFAFKVTGISSGSAALQVV